MNPHHPLANIHLDAVYGVRPGVRLEDMSRRRAARRARRLQVHFWKQGETHAYPGYTTNLSTTGMFIATTSPFPQGTRVRIEIMDRGRSFMLEGLVAHARKIRGELMRISQTGMGIRFLTVEELVRELIPVLPGEKETEEIPPSRRQEMAAAPEMAAEVEAAPFDVPERVPPAPPLPSNGAEAARPAPAIPQAPAPAAFPQNARPAAPAPSAGSGLFSVQFASARDFLEVYRRDILNGGLFVPTRYPGRIQETVDVELLPPDLNEPPFRFQARVVQRYDPHSDDLDGTNLLSGMGLEILNLPAVLDRLRPVVARFER